MPNDRTRLPLPEPAYPAGTTGRLGENTWDRHQLRAYSDAENAALRAEVECMSGEMMRAGAQVNALQANERLLIDRLWKTQQQRDRLSAALQVIADDVCDNSYTRRARAALGTK